VEKEQGIGEVDVGVVADKQFLSTTQREESEGSGMPVSMLHATLRPTLYFNMREDLP